MNETISDISKITVFLLLLLAASLFTIKSKNRLANVLFACFLITTALDFSALFLSTLYIDHPKLNSLRIASVLLQMPFFFLYVKRLCFHNSSLSIKQLVHGLPFIVFLTLFFIQGISAGEYSWYATCSRIQYYGYIVGIFYTLNQYKKLRLQNYSVQNETYTWLITTTILFLVGNTIVLFRSTYGTSLTQDTLTALNIGISLFGLAVICWFVLKTIRNPTLFRGIDKNLELVSNTATENKEKYTEELRHLKAYMTSKQPYLEDSLTLQDLAKQTQLPEKQLSYLINRVIGKHFFDYVNAFRVEKAKELLTETDLNVQQIMYEVGFNSKSSFNTAFKKNTSLTPTTFRKSTN